MKYTYLLLIPLLASFAACDEDSFSQVVEIEIPDHTSLPSVSVSFGSGDTVINQYIGISRDILAEETAPRPTSLVLLKDGVEIGRAEGTTSRFSTSNFDNSLRLSQPITDEPALYRVEASVEGYPMAISEARMPAPPNVRLIDFEPDGALDENGDRVDVVILEIDDPGGEENFYSFTPSSPLLSVSCEYDMDNNPSNCDTVITGYYSLYPSSPDPLLREVDNFGLGISDRTFDGSTYRVRLEFSNYTSDAIRLIVSALPRDSYQYLVSLDAYKDAEGNPFAEPVNVYNSIQDGYGYFIVANRKVFTLGR